MNEDTPIVAAHGHRFKNLSGQRFGRFVVQEFGGKSRNGQSLWICRCDCGQTKTVRAGHIKSGASRSCGCLLREVSSRINFKHGKTSTRTFSIWSTMVTRCINPKSISYPNYGGRGIRVCDRWHFSFSDFLADMGMAPKGKTLDRIDPNGHYEPGNCRWITQQEQTWNMRSNYMVAIGGVIKCFAQWCSELGINGSRRNRVYIRIKKLNWEPERAFNTP